MDRVFSFLLWPKREARRPWKQGRKKRGSITCCTDRANEANKMFIIWLCRLFRFWKGDRELAVRTATYGPGIDQSQHAKSVSHIIKDIIAFFMVRFRARQKQKLQWLLFVPSSCHLNLTKPCFLQIHIDLLFCFNKNHEIDLKILLTQGTFDWPYSVYSGKRIKFQNCPLICRAINYLAKSNDWGERYSSFSSFVFFF